MTKMSKKTIESYRQEIDKLDDQISNLVSKRGVLAQHIGKIKQAEGRDIFVLSREKEILNRISQNNKGPYDSLALHAIFREIISATRALENPTNVAFLGPEATFTHMAAVEQFGSSAKFLPQLNIAAVFTEVEKGHADFGVVPVENSTEGIVNYTLDKFVESDLKICAEIIIGVTHHLLSQETDLSKIKRIYSHPQALAQCRQWISVNLANAELKETDSTAGAAKKVSNEPYAAAIASGLAADMFGLNVLVKNIQDQQKNYTRFLVIGKTQSEKTNNDKTSIVFVAKDKIGVLYQLLQPLAKSHINLTKIESRPQKQKAWEYMFFVDMDGHISDKKIQRALKELESRCEFFKILGSYPKSVQNKKKPVKILPPAH